MRLQSVRPHRLLGNVALGVIAITASLLLPVTVRADIKLGIETFRSVTVTKAQWQPLADYLQAKLQEPVTLVLVPLDKIPETVGKQGVDIMLTNPSASAQIYATHGAKPLASLIQPWGSRFAGVIFSSAGSGLRTSAELKGKKLISMSPVAAGAYLFQADYLRQKGIDINKDFTEIKQVSKQESIVFAVKNGLYDVGFVRTGFLEGMVKRGKIQLDDFTVIDAVPADNSFPQIHTTALYPEWYAMVPKEFDADKAEKIKSALIVLAKDAPDAAKALGIKGFDEPLPIEDMVDLRKVFHLPPFDK